MKYLIIAIFTTFLLMGCSTPELDHRTICVELAEDIMKSEFGLLIASGEMRTITDDEESIAVAHDTNNNLLNFNDTINAFVHDIKEIGWESRSETAQLTESYSENSLVWKVEKGEVTCLVAVTHKTRSRGGLIAVSSYL